MRAIDEFFIQLFLYSFLWQVWFVTNLHWARNHTLELRSLFLKTGQNYGLSAFLWKLRTRFLYGLVLEYELLQNREDRLKTCQERYARALIRIWHNCKKRLLNSVIKTSSDFLRFSCNNWAVTISSSCSSFASLVSAQVDVSFFWHYMFAIFELSNPTFSPAECLDIVLRRDQLWDTQSCSLS